jgi:phosphonate transport system permease protein
VVAGLGRAAAVIGMTFRSISYLTQAYAESFEELDKSVIEALKASGADGWQIVFQAVIPSSATCL